ncbi:uncharacterized protein [Haliotis asinina]|uniref:uncharacterized protein n=1 Tax=Haliotis asinina TaxID=109174 RepID=UPI003531827B
MQVVYSGGSSTPTPSPRLQRKAYQGGYGRPVLPGYIVGPPPSVMLHRSKEKLTEGDTSLRDSIPAMSKPVAVFCLVLNIFIPGMGTFISGVSVLCCSEVRPKGASRRNVVWVNAGVALLQFLTTFLFLLGWIWSITWGAAFLTIAKEYGKSKEVQHTHTIKISPKHERSYQEASTSHDTLTHNSNGIVKHEDDMYLSPSAASHPQPMITLQQPPLLNHSVERVSPSRPLMNARTRHQKILQRQMSENQLSPFTLTNEKLEAIVIHDIVPRPSRAAAVQRTETVESVESVSDSEDPAGKS